jgi:hypothetical protein
MTHNCIAIFCEDIREEVPGTHSLIGVMPDNINLAAAEPERKGGALLFPKMGVYLRVNLDPQRRPRTAVSAKLIFPGGAEVSLGNVGVDLIKKAYVDAHTQGSPVVGLIFKSIISPVQFSEPGLMVVLTKIDDEEIASGSLNILMTEVVNSSQP